MTTDYHCHLLPGIDDGSATMAESVSMARTLSAAGFTTVCCTPHQIKGTYESSAAEIRIMTEQLQLQLAAETIPLQLIAGTEYSFDNYLPRFLHEPLPLPGDNILVEAPYEATAADIENLADNIMAQGFTPLIAHPERSPIFFTSSEGRNRNKLLSFFAGRTKTSQPEPSGVISFVQLLKSKGCRFQGNIGSFAGLYGDRVRQKALTLLALGVYDCFGSDAHKAAQLEDTLRRGMQALSLA